MMKIDKFPYFSLLILFLLTSCKSEKSINPLSLPAFGDNGVNVVIEIPAGSNQKIEINKSSGVFENDQKDGENRVIDFLPYPGNYGFIPSTLMKKSAGGDGDALDVLVISESLATGETLEVIPIAALKMLDGGEIDTKIIAVPVDSSRRIIQATDFEHFLIDYNMAQNIIQDWFLNYKGLGKVEMKGWFDEKYALEEIKKWQLKVE